MSGDTSITGKIYAKRAAFVHENMREPKHLILDRKSFQGILDATQHFRHFAAQSGKPVTFQGLTVSLLANGQSYVETTEEYIEIA